jgi:nucleotide-binding universal stress UspA family protein
MDAFMAAQRVLSWVRRLLAATGGQVRLLAVLPQPGPQVTLGTRTVTYADQREDTERRAAEFKLALLASRLRDDGLQVSFEVRFGEASKVAGKAAQEWPADAIALVDTPSSGPLRWFKRSLAEEILAITDLPILVARAGQRAA